MWLGKERGADGQRGKAWGIVGEMLVSPHCREGQKLMTEDMGLGQYAKCHTLGAEDTQITLMSLVPISLSVGSWL